VNCEDLPLLAKNPEVLAKDTNLPRLLVVLDTLLGDEEIPCNCDERGRLLDYCEHLSKKQEEKTNIFIARISKNYIFCSKKLHPILKKYFAILFR